MEEICIVIPHYNDLDGLVKSLASIKERSAVTAIVIDDGSQLPPNEIEIIEKIQNASLIIKIIYNRKNLGIESALNTGLKFAIEHGYNFIARLDSGDTVAPERFSKQKEYMRLKNLSLCGTWVKFVDEEYNFLFTLKHPENDSEIKKAIKRYNPFVHPSTMMTREFVISNGYYPIDYPALEDWAYFMRSRSHAIMGNMPEALTNYVVSSKSISTKRRLTQSKSKIKLLVKNFTLDLNSIVGVIKSLVLVAIPRAPLTHLKTMIMSRNHESD